MENETTNFELINANRLPISILLAVLGGIVGLIPTMISLLVFNYYIGILYALIPIGSVFGFALGKAQITKLTIVFVIIISLILPIGLVFLDYSIVLSEIGATFADLFANPEATQEFLQSLGTSLLFSGLGIFIAWGYIKKYSY